MTSRTSLIISGSSAEVGSSKSITFGSIASARAMATRCCWPPESWAGYFAAWWPTPTRSSSSVAALLGVRLAPAADLDRAEGDVLEDRLVGEEVEALEDHADLGPQVGQLLALLGQRLAVEGDRALVDGLEPVDRPAQRRLARARTGPITTTTSPRLDGQVDVLQHVQVAEPLVDVVEHDQRHRRATMPWRRVLLRDRHGAEPSPHRRPRAMPAATVTVDWGRDEPLAVPLSTVMTPTRARTRSAPTGAR